MSDVRHETISLVNIQCLYPGDILSVAGGDYNTLAISGGVVAVHIQWICNLDLDFMQHC